MSLLFRAIVLVIISLILTIPGYSGTNVYENDHTEVIEIGSNQLFENLSNGTPPYHGFEDTSRVYLKVNYEPGRILGPDGEIEIMTISNGGYQRGDRGQLEQFKLWEPLQKGELEIVDVRFKDPNTTSISPAPFIVPSPLFDLSHETDPEWKGKEGLNSGPRYEVIRKDDGDHLKIFPVEIVNGKMFCYGTVEIEYVISSSSEIFSEDIFSSRKPTGTTRYLIVTTDALKGTLQPLASWKSRKGIFTSIITVEELREIYPTGDDAKRIRKYIQELESSNDLDYVLLAGDYDKVPTRNTVNLHPETMYGEPVTFASDGYYACVDQGTTWNSDGDGLYAEGSELDDAFPDLAIGRIAINDRTVLGSVINDIIERERNISWSQEKGEVLHIVGDPKNVPGDPVDIMDHFWTEYLYDLFTKRETMHYDGTGSLSFSSGGFSNAIGEGHQAIGYFSHGQQTGIPNLFSNHQVSSLPAYGREGLFFLMACLTGWFDDPNQGNMGYFNDCFGEYMTETPRKGVSGYIGASRLAVGNIDTTYNGDAPGLEEDFWRAVREAYLGNIRSTNGDIYRYAIDHFSTSFYPFSTTYYEYSTQRTFLEYNLLGEPEAPVYLKEPQELHLDISLDDNMDLLLANVTLDNGTPVENARVTIFRWGELGVSGLTNASGQTTIIIPNSNGGRVNVTAYIPGYIMDNTTITLPDELAPQALHDLYPEVPDGWNETYITRPDLSLFGDEIVDIEYILNDGPVKRSPGPMVIELPEGNNSVRFRAIDPTGKNSTWSNINVMVDLTPPELFAVTEPFEPDGMGGVFISPVSVSVHSDEELHQVRYRIGDGYLDQYKGPISLREGNNEIYFEAFDRSGIFNSTEFVFTMDLSLPYSNMTLSHPPDGDNGYYITRPMIYLNGWDENQAVVEYRWNSGDWKKYSLPIFPEKGRSVLEYRAVDSSGNIEPYINRQTFHFDPDPPEINFTVDPPNPDGENGTYVTSPVVTIEFNDQVSEYIHSQYVIVPPGSGFDWGNDSVPFSSEINVPEGEWVVHVLAVDPAGNRRTLTPISFDVDLTPPLFRWHVEPRINKGADQWYIERPKIVIDHLSNDSQLFVSYEKKGPGTPADTDLFLKPGINELRMWVRDEAGNKLPEILFPYYCDISDPRAVITAKARTYFVNQTIELSANSSADDMEIGSYLFRSSGENISLLKTTPKYSFTPTAPGNYTFDVVVSDLSGRYNISEPILIEVVERPLDVEENDTGSLIDDPVPDRNLTGDDIKFDEMTLLKIAGGIIVLLVIALVIVLYMRKKEITEVDWTDDDEWMDEDWVDVEIDEGRQLYDFSLDPED